MMTESLTLRSLQSELFMCMFQDIGLVSRAFTVEIGLKALLKLSDQSFPNRHKLRQLFDLLPPQAQNQLEYTYKRTGRPESFPDQVLFISSVQTVFDQFDNIYTKIRYRPKAVYDGPMLSAWFNLDAAIRAIQFAILTHKSNMDMRHAMSIEVEPDSQREGDPTSD